LSLILNIETATDVCSVALTKDGNLLGLKESDTKNSHSSVLTLFMDEVVKSAKIDLADLDTIAVSEGPGSYTGLRIGVATAKGLCYALDKPMIAVNTLESMAMGMIQFFSSSNQQDEKQTLFCPMIDARRMEVYNAIIDESGNFIRESRAEVIDKNSFLDYLNKYRIVFAGSGALKCKPLFDDHPNAIFFPDFQISARFMMLLAEKKYSVQKFEDLAYFEPYYLKDFIAGKPSVKGLK
jgi:tRNA threonylcarbamoyladenosine biosynthesis protein TsaB